MPRPGRNGTDHVRTTSPPRTASTIVIDAYAVIVRRAGRGGWPASPRARPYASAVKAAQAAIAAAATSTADAPACGANAGRTANSPTAAAESTVRRQASLVRSAEAP